MTAPVGQPEASDAELVGLVLQADRDAFALVYDRYGPRLYDFAYSMLRQREDAADAVADSFVTFAEKLPRLRDADRLRPWLYAIVRSECLRRLKQRKRVSYGDDDQVAEIADPAIGPDEAAERAAVQQLVWDAAAGLADRERALLDLHLRHGLEGAELGEAMGVRAANASAMLIRLRSQVDRSLGALLIARLGREDCAALDGLLGGWDGSFSPLIRKRVARHVEGCEICGDRRTRMLSPSMLLAGVPMFAAPAALRGRVLDDTRLVAYVVPDVRAAAAEVAPRAPHGRRRIVAEVPPRAPHRRRRIVAAGIAAALLIGGAVLFWPSNDGPAKSDDLVAGQSLGGGAPSASAPTPTAAPPTFAAVPTLVAPTLVPPTLLPPTTSAPTATAAPGALSVSTNVLDLGASRSTGSFRVTNTGGTALSFLATAGTGSIRVSPASQILDPGGSATVHVAVDRSQLVEGSIDQIIDVTSGGIGSAVRLTGSNEVPPKVHPPQIGASTCSTTGRTYPVSVVATDAGGVKTVRLVWSGAASGSVQLTSSPTRWSGLMGPFAAGGPVTIKVFATDAHGNTASAVRTFTAKPCP